MNINALKELNLELLTERQRTAVSMALEGKTQAEIGKTMETSVQNVSSLIKTAIARNARLQANSKKNMDQLKQKISPSLPQNRGTDYSRYKGRDFSVLTPREQEIITLKIDGLTHQQVANKLDIHISSVGVLLQRARQKLDGTYHDGLRLIVNHRQRESRLKNPAREKENRKKTYLKYREKRIADMKKYNKKYYQRHRDEILTRQKEKRLEGK